jgi:hypothetical protein
VLTHTHEQLSGHSIIDCGIRFRGGLGVATNGNNAWSIEGSTQQTYTATNRALIDRVTELGITVNPLVSGSVSADGTVSSGCLARFQVRGDIGSIPRNGLGLGKLFRECTRA